MLAIAAPLVMAAVVLIVTVIPEVISPVVEHAAILLIKAMLDIAVIGTCNQWRTRQTQGQQGDQGQLVK